MLMAAEAEQEGRGKEGGTRERRRSTLLHPSSSPTKFDYSAYHDPVTFTYHDFTEREVGTARRPHTGLTEWECNVLHAGEKSRFRFQSECPVPSTWYRVLGTGHCHNPATQRRRGSRVQHIGFRCELEISRSRGAPVLSWFPQDPHNEGERIILVQSLVEGGVAEQDGRLRVGDRLISVNDVAVASTSLQVDAVSCDFKPKTAATEFLQSS